MKKSTDKFDDFVEYICDNNIEDRFFSSSKLKKCKDNAANFICFNNESNVHSSYKYDAVKHYIFNGHTLFLKNKIFRNFLDVHKSQHLIEWNYYLKMTSIEKAIMIYQLQYNPTQFFDQALLESTSNDKRILVTNCNIIAFDISDWKQMDLTLNGLDVMIILVQENEMYTGFRRFNSVEMLYVLCFEMTRQMSLLLKCEAAVITKEFENFDKDEEDNNNNNTSFNYFDHFFNIKILAQIIKFLYNMLFHSDNSLTDEEIKTIEESYKNLKIILREINKSTEYWPTHTQYRHFYIFGRFMYLFAKQRKNYGANYSEIEMTTRTQSIYVQDIIDYYNILYSNEIEMYLYLKQQHTENSLTLWVNSIFEMKDTKLVKILKV